MKKLFLAMIFAATTAVSFAQIGVKGGVALSNLRFNDSNNEISDNAARVGYQAGLVFKLPIIEGNLALQPEVLYAARGAKYNTRNAEVSTRFSYIDVPVLLVWNPLDGPLNIHAGPQFSRLIDVDYKYEFANDVTVKADRDNFEDWDLGLAVGLGLNFEKFFVDFRYIQGLNDIQNDGLLDGVSFDPEVKNFGFQASVGFYLF